MRVLLIDESIGYHAEFAQLLAASGVGFSALDHAATAGEGANLIARSVHQIYFVAFGLPGDSGLTLIRRARAGGIAAPIIVLADCDAPETDAAAAEAGANDFLTKGNLTARMLGHAIRYALRNAAAVQAEREAESRRRLAQEAASIGVWDWELRANTLTWSPRLYALYGWDPMTKGTVTPESWLQAVHPDDRDAVRAAMSDALSGARTCETLFRILRPDLSPYGDPLAIRWLSIKGRVVQDAAGNLTRMVGTAIDVTDQQDTLARLRHDRNQARASLVASEERFRTYFETAIDCMFHVRTQPDGRFIYEALNPVALASVGLPLEAVRGHTPEELLGPVKGRMMTDGLRRVCETGQPYRYEPTWEWDGGSVTYDAIYVPLREDGGPITGILGIARDITEHRRLEASLRQAQKMEALGQLASGVAHDFNNVLATALACFERLERHVTTDRGKRLLSDGARAVQRGTTLTGRLLTFAREQPLVLKPLDIHAALEEMSELLDRTLGAGVRIGKAFAAELWAVRGDVNQLQLAILNLAINARDAMPQGGSLTIATANETVSPPGSDDIGAGDYVVISITDTGTGMPPDVLARVLEPFYTTKEPGKGTGLGLSMVYGVVRQLGGGLRIISEPERGTSVRLYLPRAEPEAPAVAPSDRAAYGSTDHVLLTEGARRTLTG